MESSLSEYLAQILHSAEEYSADECNGGAVIELLFDLQLLRIETLEDFQNRQHEDSVKELLQEYLTR